MIITIGNLVKNFTLLEMSNKQAKEDIKLIITPEVVEFAQMIQELRNCYKKPLNVNSWYRTPTYNQQIGGSQNSLHLKGLAVDLAVTEYKSLTSAWKAICNQHHKVGGINYYNTFMHFDNAEHLFGYKLFQIRDYRR